MMVFLIFFSGSLFFKNIFVLKKDLPVLLREFSGVNQSTWDLGLDLRVNKLHVESSVRWKSGMEHR